MKNLFQPGIKGLKIKGLKAKLLKSHCFLLNKNKNFNKNEAKSIMKNSKYALTVLSWNPRKKSAFL